MRTIHIESSWYPLLQSELRSNYMKMLSRFLRNELRLGKLIYPPGKEIFNAFTFTPFPETKVVILGQDPYHGPQQAHGLSFSVRDNIHIPPSLKNIFIKL